MIDVSETDSQISLEKLIEAMTPEVYQNLKTAIELGKWENGIKLSRQQLDSSLQAVIAYDNKHFKEEQRIGFIHKGSKQGSSCDKP